MIPYVIAFVGTVGNIASDTAMVVIPPMAAIVYMGVGQAPGSWYDGWLRRVLRPVSQQT